MYAAPEVSTITAAGGLSVQVEDAVTPLEPLPVEEPTWLPVPELVPVPKLVPVPEPVFLTPAPVPLPGSGPDFTPPPSEDASSEPSEHAATPAATANSDQPRTERILMRPQQGRSAGSEPLAELERPPGQSAPGRGATA